MFEPAALRNVAQFKFLLFVFHFFLALQQNLGNFGQRLLKRIQASEEQVRAAEVNAACRCIGRIGNCASKRCDVPPAIAHRAVLAG